MDNRLIAPNRTKRVLAEGRAVLGTMVAEIRQPAIMQLLVNGGFDFAVIDNEHGPFTIETIADLSRTAVALGITPIVRVPDIAYPYIALALEDAGAQGIMAPPHLHGSPDKAGGGHGQISAGRTAGVCHEPGPDHLSWGQCHGNDGRGQPGVSGYHLD